MKPHVAALADVEAKYLLVADDTEPAVPLLLPSMHSREGEKRRETAALIAVVVRALEWRCTWRRKESGLWKAWRCGVEWRGNEAGEAVQAGYTLVR